MQAPWKVRPRENLAVNDLSFPKAMSIVWWRFVVHGDDLTRLKSHRNANDQTGRNLNSGSGNLPAWREEILHHVYLAEPVRLAPQT